MTKIKTKREKKEKRKKNTKRNKNTVNCTLEVRLYLKSVLVETVPEET